MQPLTQARLNTEPDRLYEVVRYTDDALYVLREAGNDITTFEDLGEADQVEIHCDFCGRWSTDAAPVAAGDWQSWMCYGGSGPCPT
jgi:hypothetical protein